MELNTFSLSITLIIIIITVAVSIIGFGNAKVVDQLIFYPPDVSKRKQWYRFITCGFIHADTMHLAFNMYSFWMFGGVVEFLFMSIYGERGKMLYVVLYFSALIVCLLPTYFKNIDNYYYRSLGASGAVSAVVFTYMFLAPMSEIGLLFIPVRFPAFIFGIAYLIISAYLDKKGGGNINHSAHFWGAIYGVVFVIVTCYFLTDHRPVQEFVDQVQGWFSSKFGR
jgi:membrane associated rhomboid family serine protease